MLIRGIQDADSEAEAVFAGNQALLQGNLVASPISLSQICSAAFDRVYPKPGHLAGPDSRACHQWKPSVRSRSSTTSCAEYSSPWKCRSRYKPYQLFSRGYQVPSSPPEAPGDHRHKQQHTDAPLSCAVIVANSARVAEVSW